VLLLRWRLDAATVVYLSNFIHHQVIEREKNKQKTKYNKHQNTTGTLDYQAVAHV